MRTIILAASLALAPLPVGAFEFTADGVEIDVYGYLMGKAAFDVGEDLGSALGVLPASVALEGSPSDEESGHWDATANQSRIGLRLTGDEAVGVLEGDFAPGHLRLRHAYFVYEGFLVGQTWSNFHGPMSVMPSVDFDGLVGVGGYAARLPQLRYTTGAWSASVEDPGASFAVTDAEVVGADELIADARAEDSWLRSSLKYEQVWGELSYALAVAAQGLEYDAGAGADIEREVGYGALAAASYAFDDFVLRGNLNYSNGINSYVTGLYSDDAYVTDAGEIETIDSVSGTVSITVPVGPGAASAGYGRVVTDYPEFFPTRNRVLENVLLNYLWSPAERITYGVEYGWYAREQVNGASGKAHRLAFSAAYAF